MVPATRRRRHCPRSSAWPPAEGTPPPGPAARRRGAPARAPARPPSLRFCRISSPPPVSIDLLKNSWQIFPNGNVSRPARETDNERVGERVVLRRELTRMLLATPRATASPVHVHRPAFNVARSDSNRQTRGARQAERVRARSYRSSGARERRGKATVAPRAAEAGESKSSSMDGWTGRWFDSIRSSPSQSPWTQRVSNSRPFVRFPSFLADPLPHCNDNAF